MVENESKKFIEKMLDLCTNADEALLLLNNDEKIRHYFADEVHHMIKGGGGYILWGEGLHGY